MDHIKIPLPRFLKLFTDNEVPMPKAMAIASKIYKDYNSPATLGLLNEVRLVAAGVNNKEERRLIMAALRQSGHVSKGPPRKKIKNTSGKPYPSESTIPEPTGKRKRQDDINELLPNGPIDEAARYGNHVFDEILDEQILMTKSTVVNRAPLMTAWATVVAERIGFKREEALSIASAYTEMNAVTKGVSLGIHKHGEERNMEATKGGSQSYVELMGRRPLYRNQVDQWRALSSGSPIQPSIAFSYISRAFRQTTPHVIGSLRLLAASFTVDEINSKAWSLYANFRPVVDEWGRRSEVKCSTILGLRKTHTSSTTGSYGFIQSEKSGPLVSEPATSTSRAEREPQPKYPKSLTLEEYEAILDQDFAYDELDFTALSQGTI
ncbi:hypothetical protein BDZ94DRAFT_1162134 [Collybia nuda]|uniref:Uncharacterized protein n=1 Tax=Collybia nuda TaxID=64659 RepID=A0A9P5YAU0_9AGAR|nr:hypothetical protein BDZ94DRAFT_1162134 [Collybia nuda]